VQALSHFQPQQSARLMIQPDLERRYLARPQEVPCNYRKTWRPQHFQIRICIA
jgi:hypothetical protein